MLCTLCHHDVHRQGWEILARAGHVDFIPPSTIDPTRRPRPVGLAAITIEDTDGTDCTDCTDGTDPPRHDTWESSVPNHGGTCGAGENSDLDQSRVDAAGDQSPWDNAA